MNILLPQINDKVVEFEKYTTAVEIRNKIGRNYFLKMVQPVFWSLVFHFLCHRWVQGVRAAPIFGM